MHSNAHVHYVITHRVMHLIHSFVQRMFSTQHTFDLTLKLIQPVGRMVVENPIISD